MSTRLINSITTRNLLPLLLYFTFFILAGLFFSQPVHVLPWNASNLDIRHYFGYDDQASFALGGWIIFSKGWFGPDTAYLISAWPPGFMLLQGILLKIFGAAAPIILILQVLAAATLAITINLFRVCLEGVLNKYFATFIPLILLASTEFRNFMLGQGGVLLGATFAVSFFLIGFLCLLLAVTNKKTSFALIAGFTFALSAYFRSQYETFFIIGTLNFLVIFFAIKIFHTFKKIKYQTNNLHTKETKSAVFFIFISLIVFHLLTTPYRLYTYERTGSPAWVQTTDAIFRQNLTSNSQLLKMGIPEVSIADGRNIPCLIDKNLCDQLSNRLDTMPITAVRHQVISTFLTHPFQWIFLKYSFFPKFWFGNLTNFDAMAYPAPPSFYSFIENFSFFLGFICSMVLMLCLAGESDFLINYWISTTLIVSYFLIFLFAHFEARYFYLFKIFFYMSAMLYLAKLILHLAQLIPPRRTEYLAMPPQFKGITLSQILKTSSYIRKNGVKNFIHAAFQKISDTTITAYLITYHKILYRMHLVQRIHDLKKLKLNTVLIIDHAYIGGSTFYRNALVSNFLTSKKAVAVISYDAYFLIYKLQYFTPDTVNEFTVEPYIFLKLLKYLTRTLKIKTLIFNNCVSFPNPLELVRTLLKIKRLYKIETTMLLHDFFAVCPSYNLLNDKGNFCNIPNINDCKTCLKSNKNSSYSNVDILKWRATWKTFLSEARTIKCFSYSSRELLLKSYPDLNEKSIVIEPHSVNYINKQKITINLDKPLHIGIVGFIAYNKGFNIIRKMAEIIDKESLNIQMTIIGTCAEPIPEKCLTVTGPFQREQLRELIIKSGANFFLVPSVCPETFSYVTHELMQLTVPTAAFNLGAQAEAIKKYEHGFILHKLDPKTVLNNLIYFHQQLKVNSI